MSDRLPPYAEESERAIIGCCLNLPVVSLPEAQQFLTAEHFYDLRNQKIWEAINSLPLEKVNVMTVFQKLKDDKTSEQVGGIAYLCEAQNNVAGLESQLSTWLEIVVEKFTLRKIIKTCVDIVGEAYESINANLLLDKVETEILAIRPNQTNATDIKSLVREATHKLEFKATNPDKMGGLSTGLSDLDRLTDGIHGGEMIVVAGFPSTGKTALSVNIAVFNALAGIPTAVFSAEMRPVQLVVRSLCSEARVNYHRITNGDIPKLTTATARLATSKIHIEAANRLTIGQVAARARRLKQKHDIKMIVVDYIQLLQGIGDNREQEISSISKGLKAIALELEVPVLALSQLTDDGKLRESRSIGQDADSVWKLENDGEWQAHVQPIKLRVEKCRDGETGIVNLTFLKTITRFENASKVDYSDVPYSPE